MEIELQKNQEYRIEVSESQKLKVMVIGGLAEIKGQELLNDKWYIFSDTKTAIFTFLGCKLKVDGMSDLKYTAFKSSMPDFFKYFDKNKNVNKTILLIGKGRTFFCTSICNYFVRLHKKVDFYELDPSKGNIFPGTLSYLHIDTFVDFLEGFKLNSPTCLFYGSLTIDNLELYNLQCSKLHDIVTSQNSYSNNFKIVLCPNISVDEINLIAKIYKADEIVVVGDERLFHMSDFIIPKIYIENTAFIYENRVNKSIHRYFNGYQNEYTPSSFSVKYDWEIYRIGELHSAPESALPLGATRRLTKTDPIKAELVENSVLGISEAESEDQIATSPVVGFIVCVEEKKIRVLCTQPKLPKLKYLIQGDFKYLDF